MTTLRRRALVLGLLLLPAAHAQAQTAPDNTVFLNINGGYQTGSQVFSDAIPLALYGEQGRTDVHYEVERSGGLVDVSAGVRVWRNLAIGVGVSSASTTSRADVTAAAPHPLFFQRPRQAQASVEGLEHSAVAVDIQAVWVVRASSRVEVALSGGPSFFNISQGVVTGVTIGEVRAPFDRAAIAGVAVSSLSETATGFNAGVDITVLWFRHLGLGLLVRYSGASVEVGLSDGPVSVQAGGAQAGAGLRIRF